MRMHLTLRHVGGMLHSRMILLCCRCKLQLVQSAHQLVGQFAGGLWLLTFVVWRCRARRGRFIHWRSHACSSADRLVEFRHSNLTQKTVMSVSRASCVSRCSLKRGTLRQGWLAKTRRVSQRLPQQADPAVWCDQSNTAWTYRTAARVQCAR